MVGATINKTGTLTGGKTLLVGNRKLMRDSHIALDGHGERAAAMERAGRTVVYSAMDGQFAGLLAIADAMRPNAKLAVEKLMSMGVQVAMLTGDNCATAERIAGELGIKTVRGVAGPEGRQSERTSTTGQVGRRSD